MSFHLSVREGPANRKAQPPARIAAAPKAVSDCLNVGSVREQGVSVGCTCCVTLVGTEGLRKGGATARLRRCVSHKV